MHQASVISTAGVNPSFSSNKATRTISSPTPYHCPPPPHPAPDEMLVHYRVTPALNSAVPIYMYIAGCREEL